MTVAVITASVGCGIPITPLLPQSVPGVDFYPFTDTELPPRPQTLQPRMLAKIPKVWGWQMVSPHDVYLWIDAVLTLIDPDAVRFLVTQLGEADLACFRHPLRRSVAQEAAFLRQHLLHSRRLMQRYLGEYLDAQLAAIADQSDDALYAAGCFAYRLTDRTKQLMATWWEHMTRYHVNDQLSWPYAMKTSGAVVHRIDLDIWHNRYVGFPVREDHAIEANECGSVGGSATVPS